MAGVETDGSCVSGYGGERIRPTHSSVLWSGTVNGTGGVQRRAGFIVNLDQAVQRNATIVLARAINPGSDPKQIGPFGLGLFLVRWKAAIRADLSRHMVKASRRPGYAAGSL